MLHRRRGSVIAYAISLTAMFLTMIVATMSYFESSNKQATSEKWRDVAEQAARSGLDFVMGWGESSIDRNSRLPSEWEMDDGEAMDPVRAYLDTRAGGAAIQPNASAVVGMANPIGQVLGNQVGEFVLGRVGNYVITFKARVQQFRFSNDAPKQYRVGVVGRVRRAAANPGAAVSVDVNEKTDIVSERMLIATLGKEPFSRYAALIDYDAVKNWVPGEQVEGPVHINRGYVDVTGVENLQFGSPTFQRDRSFMRIHLSPGSFGFQAPAGKPGYPVFLDRVSMTASNTGNVANTPSDDDMSGNSFIQVDNIPNVSQPAAITQLANVFRAPENATALNGNPGPVILPSPIPLPPNSRRRLPVAIGVPPTRTLNDYQPAFNNLEDGIYVFTKRMMETGASTGAGAGATLSNFSYSGGGDDFAAGGIYIRGNVDVMRMSVNGQFSYYIFQLGNGGYPGGTHRIYIIRANRVTRAMEMVALAPSNVATELQAVLAGGTVDARFTAPVSNTPSQFTIRGSAGAIRAVFPPVTQNYGNHPFNGQILVDCSRYDPYRWDSPAVQANTHPCSGNIYCLGDPTPGTKTNLYGSPLERVATNDNADPAAATNCSRLTIITAGHMFIQNHLVLEAIRAQGGNLWNDPKGDSIPLNMSRDLIGLVADRQVLLGLTAPGPLGGNRANYGCVIHAAVAALGDPDPSVAGRAIPRAYWGSVATEGLQAVFGSTGEDYDTLSAPLYTAGYPNPQGGTYYTMKTDLNGVSRPVYSAAARYHGVATQKNIPGNSLFAAYNESNNPNVNPRGRLVIFGSVTQRKRGAIGAGNLSYDKDFRYDKRLLSIAPPNFPSSTNITMRVSTVTSSADFPYRGGTTNGVSANQPDLNFFGVPSGPPMTPP